MVDYIYDDGTTRLQHGSKHRRGNVEPGSATVTPIEVTKIKWAKKEVMVGKSVDAQIESVGYKNGTPVFFEFFDCGVDKRSDVVIKMMETTISGNKASVTFSYPEEFGPRNNPARETANSKVQFTVSVPVDEGASMTMKAGTSPKLSVYSKLKVKVESEEGRALPDVKIKVKSSDNITKTYTTDSAGMIKVDKIWARNHLVLFPTSNRIVAPGENVTDLSAAPSYKVVYARGDEAHVFKLLETMVYCTHKIDGKRRVAVSTDLFEVVPNPTGTTTYKDDVMILSRTATSLSAGGKTLSGQPDEFGMHAFKLECIQDYKYVKNIFDPNFWKGLIHPKEYSVSGLPMPLTVKCYRPDRFKVQVQFPSMRKWSGGYKVAVEKATFVNDVKNGRMPVSNHHDFTDKKEGWKLGTFPKPMSPDAPVMLEHNGTKVKLDFLESVGSVVTLMSRLEGIITTIQKNVPKVGWYVEWDNQIFQGTFVVEWGWKEYKDHRAFYYWGVNLDLKLIDLNFEVGIGLSAAAYKVQLYGKIMGSVSVSAKLSRVSPDGKVEFSVPFAAQIIGALGVRGQLGCLVKAEGTAETGIEVKDGAFKFSKEDGISGECKLEWIGIKGTFKVSVGPAKKGGTEEENQTFRQIAATRNELNNEPGESDSKLEQAYQRELMGSKTLKTWHWSSKGKEKETYEPVLMPRKELHTLLDEKLGDFNIKTGRAYGLNQHMDKKEMIEAIENKIHARSDIKKDPKSMEALVFDIKNTLEDLVKSNEENKWYRQDHMKESQWTGYVNNGGLDNDLNKLIDPINEVVKRYQV